MTALDPTTADRILTPPSTAWSTLAFGDINLVPAAAPNPVSATTGYSALDMLSDNGASDVVSDAPMVPTGDFAMFIAIAGPIGTSGWNLFWGDHWLDIELTATTVNYVGIGNHYFYTNPTLVTPLDADITVLAFRWDSVNGGAMHTSRDGLVGTDSTLMTPASGTVYMYPAPDGTKAEVLGAWLFESTTVDETTADDTIAAIMALFPEVSLTGAGGWGVAGAGTLSALSELDDPTIPSPVAGGSVIPPAVPTFTVPPGVPDTVVRHVWEDMGVASVDANSWPEDWAPTSVTDEEYGRFQIVVEGTDVTWLDGVPTPLPRYSRVEPFGSQSAQIQLPQLHAFRSVPAWAKPGANVDIRLVKIEGGYTTVFTGDVVELARDEDSGVFSLQCMGCLFAADLQLSPPSFSTAPQDTGTRIASLLNNVVSRRYADVAAVTTGNPTSVAGGWKPILTGAVQDLLATAVTAGKQWTVKCDERSPVIALKDTTTIAWTIRTGQRGYDINLSQDSTEAVNVIFGEGVAADGGSWRNAKYPNWKPDDTPAYPFASPSTTIVVGTTDADTDSGDGVSVWQAKMGRPVTGTFSLSDRTALIRLQISTAIDVDGILGPQSWASTFDTGANTGTLDGAFIAPLAASTKVTPRLYGPDGDDLGANPDYDPDMVRVEEKRDYGQGVSHAVGTQAALAEVARTSDPGWQGTITFTLDPEGFSRFELKEGQNGRILGWQGSDITVHVASVDADPEAGTVTVQVDTRARDYPTLDAIRERDRNATDPAKAAIKRLLSGSVSSDRATFDAESPAGRMPKHAIFSNLWDVRRIPMGAFGIITRTEFTTTGSAAPFALAVFGKAVTAADLLAVVGNPLTTGATESPWSAQGDALDEMGLLQAWGWKEQPAGYYPRQYQNPAGTTAAPVTGRLVDDASWDYASEASPWIWVATIAQTSCYVQGRFYGRAS